MNMFGGSISFLESQFQQRLVQVCLFSAILFWLLGSYKLIDQVQKLLSKAGLRFGKDSTRVVHALIFGTLLYVLTRFIMDPVVRRLSNGSVIEGQKNAPAPAPAPAPHQRNPRASHNSNSPDPEPDPEPAPAPASHNTTPHQSSGKASTQPAPHNTTPHQSTTSGHSTTQPAHGGGNKPVQPHKSTQPAHAPAPAPHNQSTVPGAGHHQSLPAPAPAPEPAPAPGVLNQPNFNSMAMGLRGNF